MFSVQTPALGTQVAQGMAVRRHMARTLALRTVVPVAWRVPPLLATAWWVVGSTPAPLQCLRSQLAPRRAAPTTWRRWAKPGHCPTRSGRGCMS